MNYQPDFALVFCYAKDGRVKCLTLASNEHTIMLSAGWKHTATINAATWIERLLSVEPSEASDMMDELNFGPQNNQTHDNAIS